MEFKRAEKTKDYALLRKLQEAKNALDEKIRRKAAQGAMTSNIIVGAFTIAGAVIVGSQTGGVGAAQGAAGGAAVGQMVAGGVAANNAD